MHSVRDGVFWLAVMWGCGPGDPGTQPTRDIAPSIEVDATPCNLDTPVHQPHNVLVVLMDDVGIDRVAAYDEHPAPASTPTLDGLAAEGVLFRNAYSSPVCTPSRAATLTGRYGWRYGIGRNVFFHTDRRGLPNEELTFAEVVAYSSAATYDTALIGKWHLTPQSDPTVLDAPTLQGFAWFEGSLSQVEQAYDESDGLEHDYFHWERITNSAVEHVDSYSTTTLVDATVAQIEAMAEPWVLYLPFHAAHGPQHVPPAHLHDTDATESSSEGDRNLAVVEALDTELGRMLLEIPADVLARTTLILTADNGTSQDNIHATWPADRGKGTLYEGGINVPMIVTGPLVADPGSESDALVHLVDILPTVADIACVDLGTVPTHDGQPLVVDGQSLVPWLVDDAAAEGREVLFTGKFSPQGPPPYNTEQRAIRNDRYKLISDGITGADELYLLDSGAYSEGEDLLAASLDAEQQAAYDALTVALAGIMDQLNYTFED